MMRILTLGLSLVLLLGCESYSVELDSEWEGDSSETSTADPSTEDPTDTEAPWIELSEDDDATDPDDSDPSIPDECAGVICSEMGPLCYDIQAVDCCTPCEAGTKTCHLDSPMNFHDQQFICAGGCWETDSYCDYGTYCKEETNGELGCAPLPTGYDDFCDPQFEWVDPDCQTCSACDYPGESYCDRSGISPDALIRCEDFTGYGHYCWSYELCSSSGFDNFCVEDFAQNLAACTGFETQEMICSQFVCTGVTTCDPEGTGTISDCGYCNTCCDVSYGPLCGYGGPDQSGSAILNPNADNSCYEPQACNLEPNPGSTSNYCRMSDDGVTATCEPANFFGP